MYGKRVEFQKKVTAMRVKFPVESTGSALALFVVVSKLCDFVQITEPLSICFLIGKARAWG